MLKLGLFIEDLKTGIITGTLHAINPAVMEKVKVDTEIRKLDVLRSAHFRRRFEMRNRIAPTISEIKAQADQTALVKADIQTRNENVSDQFSMIVAGRLFEGKEAREQAAQALNETILKWQASPHLKGCGKIAGFDVLCRGEAAGTVSGFLRGAATYSINYNPDSPIGTMMSIEHTIRGLETVQSRLEKGVTDNEKALAEYKLQSEKPFEHEERLKELMAEQQRLSEALDLDKSDAQALVTDNDNGDTEYPGMETFISVDAPERFDNDNEELQKNRNKRINAIKREQLP